MDALRNILAAIPTTLSDELVETLASGKHARVERIVSRGHASPPGFAYDQPEHEWVMVVAGRGRLTFEDGEVIEMGPGDYLNIPAHRRHRVDWTDPATATVWLAIFYT